MQCINTEAAFENREGARQYGLFHEGDDFCHILWRRAVLVETEFQPLLIE
jgi:hypothetical protein